ncbi:sensor histidine kinase [Halopseudomonas salegens]|uniref:histidine kinase n=1 Tax=Halopseudomonas salegens TaxID=1434072 RepID=A0A1H2H3I8_9GAMM|nr:ATP-binding protein [Halopseudomonas salegens]SDU26118.1 CBS domain-containing protein [Halopseudomonas salegens]
MSSNKTLADLCHSVDPLSAELTINDVADRLLEPAYKGFLSLPVVDADNRPLGLVSRYRLQNIFMQRFGRDLWGRHPVTEASNPDSLIIKASTALDRAANIITGQLQYPITEDFILVDGDGRYLGLGTVMDLLRAMEHRIEQRNQALQQALKQLKQSQSHLVQAEKMASLGQMVAGVAHELNTPLGYIKNNVQLLGDLVRPVLELADQQDHLMQLLNDPQASDEQLAESFAATRVAADAAAPAQLAEDLGPLLEDTQFGLEQIAELAISLKDFARLDRAMTEAVDLNECVHNALVIARNVLKDNAEVITRLGDLPVITCTPSQINQVLLNLLTNAAQAMERPGQILIRTWSEQDQVHLSVQDNGRGIPEAAQKRIFDPFFTTKSVGQGTGLGLSICYQIIRDHGGRIRFKSEPGRGTRFLISLPISQDLALSRSA